MKSSPTRRPWSSTRGPPMASFPCSRSRSAYAKWDVRALAILSKSPYLTKLMNFMVSRSTQSETPSAPSRTKTLRLSNLIEKFLHRLANTLESVNLCHREIRMRDVPALRGDLVLGEVVLRPGAANARPAVPRRIDDIEVIGDRRYEVVD